MLPLQQERRGGGAEAAEYRCGVFSAHTFRSTLTHPSIRAHSNHPCGTCLVSLLGQVALPRTGMGCATSSRFCKLLLSPSVGSTALTSSGCAPSWCKLGGNPQALHPLHVSDLPQPLPQSELSNSLSISEPGSHQARAAGEPLVVPKERAAPPPCPAPPGGDHPYAQKESPSASPRVPAVAPQPSFFSPASTLRAARTVAGRRRPALSAPTERAPGAPRALPSRTQPVGSGLTLHRPRLPGPRSPLHRSPPPGPDRLLARRGRGGRGAHHSPRASGNAAHPDLQPERHAGRGSPQLAEPSGLLRAPHPPAAAAAPAYPRTRAGRPGPGAGAREPARRTSPC